MSSSIVGSGRKTPVEARTANNNYVIISKNFKQIPISLNNNVVVDLSVGRILY